MSRLNLPLALLAVGALVGFAVLQFGDHGPSAPPGPSGTTRTTQRPGGLQPLPAGSNGSPPTCHADVTEPKDPNSAVPWWCPKISLVLGDPKTSGLPGWTPDFDAEPVAAYDFDGDGVKEIVAHGNDSSVYVFSARTGKVLASFKTTLPAAWHIERVLNGVVVAQLGPKEPPSLVVTNHAAYVGVWQYVPARSTGDHFVFAKKWEKRMDDCYPQPSMDAAAAVGDLDGDGNLDIAVQTEELGYMALRKDGTELWKQCWGGGNSAPVIADLQGDGKPEVVVGNDNGLLSVFRGADGVPEWTFDAQKQGVFPASISVTPVVAQLPGGGPKSVLFTTRQASLKDPAQYQDNHLVVFAVRGGQLLWKASPAWANPLSYTRLVVADADGDGAPEVYGMDWNTIGHIPGDWEVFNGSHVFSLDGATGDERWHVTLDAWWSNKELVLADFDGDGRLELLANGPRDGFDGFWRIDAKSGALEAFLAVWPWKVERGAEVLDVFGRDTMQLVVPVRPVDDVGPPNGAVLVYDLNKPLKVAYPGLTS